MIDKILMRYAERLEEYLSAFHHQPEGLATVETIGKNRTEQANKLVICLLNVERATGEETPATGRRQTDENTLSQAPFSLNLTVVLAAVYEEHRYKESLTILADTLRFIQSSPKFQVNGTDYTTEIVNLSTPELNQVWSLLGGQYYPSVICKIKGICIS
ncbi:MAG TPA: DUF4255 domain-containing protein [Candidatus Barnesiella excrementavium]|nr:DUF4255 domain-containing protein [Candidatus Barnesiella excrementavium]